MMLNTIPQNYIINIATETGGKEVSNFLLHGLRIENDSDEKLILKEINFEIYASGHFVKQITYQGEALQNIIKEFAEKATWLDRGFGAKLFLGEEGFFQPEYYTKSVAVEC